MLKPENLFKIWQTIRSDSDNLNEYIDKEFLASIKTPECSKNVRLWFDDIKLGKFWALRSYN